MGATLLGDGGRQEFAGRAAGPVICVCGPTASGKSALADQVALRLGTDVISVDSMQVYRGMDIGTAKTPATERSVPLQMVDVADISQDYSVSDFQRDARALVDERLEGGKAAVLCGGTGLYLDAVIDEMVFPHGETHGKTRSVYEGLAEERGPDALWDLLRQRDPASAKLIHVNNVRRVVRALEMLDEGVSYAEHHEGLKCRVAHYEAQLWGLSWPREELYRRINLRVDLMFEQGLVDEVRRLVDRGLGADLTARQAIGYKEVLDYLDGSLDLYQCVELIKQRTRRYAKRQLSWLRRDGRVTWLDMATASVGEACEAICKRYKEYIMGRFKFLETAPVPERALIVGVDTGKAAWPIEESLDELERLVETANGTVVARETQRLSSPIPKTFVGSGKADELAGIVRRMDIDIVVFDDELSPSQQSNLERIFGRDVKVIDRTALILDIFGRHANTREGRLQVQLAQLQYVLPRLRGMWSHLMGQQTRGGIGSRFGQGESQLEVDRRLVRDRVASLRRELKQLEVRRSTQSKARWESGMWRVALAGYTNAGKSTLLNALTDSGVYAKDELFATLDPTTRTIDLAEGRKITLTDTVGFVQKLPHTLVESFKSTLAEVKAANLILEVVDASDVAWHKKLDAVEEVLGQIEATGIRKVVVFNKCDLVDSETLDALRLSAPDAEFVSAETGFGLDDLLHRIALEAAKGDVTLTALIPYEKGLLVKMAHERCQVIREQYVEGGLLVTLKADERMAATLMPYKVEEQSD